MSITSPDNTPPINLPVHIDPMPIGHLGMWFFIASEAMFFVGLLGAFMVLQSTGSSHLLFVKSSVELNRSTGGLGVVLLMASSIMLAIKAKRFLQWIAISLSILFLGLQAWQWQALRTHHTVVEKRISLLVIDGYENFSKPTQLDHARVIDLPNSFDIYQTTRSDFPTQPDGSEPVQDGAFTRILMDVNYGPSRNNYFACYFLMTAVHSLHLLIGIFILAGLTLKRRALGSLQIYWHFVNAVGVIGFATLYFV